MGRLRKRERWRWRLEDEDEDEDGEKPERKTGGRAAAGRWIFLCERTLDTIAYVTIVEAMLL